MPGASSLGEQVCPRCSKDIDRSLGVLGIFGIEILLPDESAEIARGVEAIKKAESG